MEEKATCPHEDDVIYGKLIQRDGEPIYEVTCGTCGASGVIRLVEDGEEWAAPVNTSSTQKDKNGDFIGKYPDSFTSESQGETLEEV